MIEGALSKLYQSQILNRVPQFKTSFQRMGSDLQSGNLSAAQQDFVNLTTSGLSATIPPSMQQLATDLRSGDLPSAQQDYITVQRALQQHVFAKAQTASAPGATSSVDPLGLLKNLAATAASAYAGAGVAGANLAL